MDTDPLKRAEVVLKEVHDAAGKYTRPVFSRYPLLFSFLVVFSVAAILHGFELVAERIPLFQEHPSYLIIIGTVALFSTGMLYKSLRKMK